MLNRSNKQDLLKQKAKVIWLTGYSGSGKTTIAVQLEKYLHKNGYLVKILDNDTTRSTINSDLSFSLEDRKENIRRTSEICKMFIDCGIITIATFISPTKEIRDIARNIIGEDDFIHIYVNCPLDICEARDVKGLYKQAREGKIQGFFDLPFEEPINYDIEVKTSEEARDTSVNKIIDYIMPIIKHDN